jgi:hypothetical protein
MRWKYYTLVHPRKNGRDETVRVAVGGEQSMFIDIFGKRGYIREPKPGEIAADYNAAQDTGADYDRTCLLYPDDREKIIRLIEDWNSPFSLDDVLRIVAERCNDECRTAGETYDFLQKHYPNRMDATRLTRDLFNILNFDGVRENAKGLRELALDSQARDFRLRRAGLD